MSTIVHIRPRLQKATCDYDRCCQRMALAVLRSIFDRKKAGPDQAMSALMRRAAKGDCTKTMQQRALQSAEALAERIILARSRRTLEKVHERLGRASASLH